ncbi:hypothetical protein DPMN_180238 [Dreissena polymorpha]|uniref:Uncharacterized protein n=2 Tax=Dreissena polymorpha TaxID=45954 RepID=A0A9D4EED1_DREPO|nr:hypothetical protein DPMN_180238 [Dreissena polymorpha]
MLENTIRKHGGDPGIHQHCDLTGIDIWKGLREERRDLMKATGDEATRKELNRKTIRVSIDDL